MVQRLGDFEERRWRGRSYIPKNVGMKMGGGKGVWVLSGSIGPDWRRG